MLALVTVVTDPEDCCGENMLAAKRQKSAAHGASRGSGRQG